MDCTLGRSGAADEPSPYYVMPTCKILRLANNMHGSPEGRDSHRMTKSSEERNRRKCGGRMLQLQDVGGGLKDQTIG